MTIQEKEIEIREEFELFGDDWEGKYEHLIEMGKSLKNFPEELKTEERLIKGCQSRVWLHSELKNGIIEFYADSDAIITKGIVALLIRMLSGQRADDIATADLDIIHQIGLKEHLSPTRANGLVSMIQQMKLDALALKMKSNLH